jgi:hypothetical protein
VWSSASANAIRGRAASNPASGYNLERDDPVARRRELSTGACRRRAAVPRGLALSGAAQGASRKRRLDRHIVRALPRGRQAPTVVFVPGLLGSQLLRPDGSVAWRTRQHRHHDLTLPRQAALRPLATELVPGF